MAVDGPISRTVRTLTARRFPELTNPRPGTRVPELHLTYRNVGRYAFDRARIAAATRLRRGEPTPWLTAESIQLLDELIRADDEALEYGSGRSTRWLASRVASLRSVEENDDWHAAVTAELAARGVANVRLELASTRALGRDTDEHREAYVNAHADIAPESLGLVLVDGEYRDRCALRALDLLRPTGIFVLDNANTYLPSPSRSPWRVSAPATAGWQEFLDRVAGWRHVWTSNGSWDTALWLKP